MTTLPKSNGYNVFAYPPQSLADPLSLQDDIAC